MSETLPSDSHGIFPQHTSSLSSAVTSQERSPLTTQLDIIILPPLHSLDTPPLHLSITIITLNTRLYMYWFCYLLFITLFYKASSIRQIIFVLFTLVSPVLRIVMTPSKSLIIICRPNNGIHFIKMKCINRYINYKLFRDLMPRKAKLVIWLF